MKMTLISAALLASSTAFAGDYKIDETHSVATFLISHLGFAKLPGRFNEMAGTYRHADDFSTVELSVTVNAASVDTNHGKRDEHLAGPDFFDSRQYPEITFVSTNYAGDAAGGVLSGDLTMMGVTKTVAFDVVVEGEGDDPWGNYRQGLTASTTLDRTEYGMNYGVPGIPAEFDVVVYIEGVRQ
ncbi:hypothetical protein GH975_07760 [Litorivicinus lipolyticus]|uniref:Lipid/polyisoprenoid-binding YceI-like domain-containing protein n=1 Tax=Litorivicinus lipolyticus TaxID=418701 RepID=A0A5Q2QHH5_9GAMM|nr:YceI family protein [Litorivicinus lipolyticus]QGG80475.1 hypothetical protein GH975_07760 [Litorivicinus lipolyticus]